MKRNMILVFAVLSFAAGCANVIIKTPLTPIKCVLIGNTYPESPFAPVFPSSGKLITAISRENPAFVINTGNAIFAGTNSGIREIDIFNQYDEQQKTFDIIPSLKYNIGEYDLYNGSSNIYTQKTGNQPDYSFSYGRMLFVMLNSSTGIVTEDQQAWFENEITSYENISAIYIITYAPLFPPKGSQIQAIKNAESLHHLFVKEKVSGVISGSGELFFRSEKDGIQYINAGSTPLFKPAIGSQWKYYILTIGDSIIDIHGKNF